MASFGSAGSRSYSFAFIIQKEVFPAGRHGSWRGKWPRMLDLILRIIDMALRFPAILRRNEPDHGLPRLWVTLQFIDSFTAIGGHGVGAGNSFKNQFARGVMSKNLPVFRSC